MDIHVQEDDRQSVTSQDLTDEPIYGPEPREILDWFNTNNINVNVVRTNGKGGGKGGGKGENTFGISIIDRISTIARLRTSLENHKIKRDPYKTETVLRKINHVCAQLRRFGCPHNIARNAIEPHGKKSNRQRAPVIGKTFDTTTGLHVLPGETLQDRFVLHESRRGMCHAPCDPEKLVDFISKSLDSESFVFAPIEKAFRVELTRTEQIIQQCNTSDDILIECPCIHPSGSKCRKLIWTRDPKILSRITDNELLKKYIEKVNSHACSLAITRYGHCSVNICLNSSCNNESLNDDFIMAFQSSHIYNSYRHNHKYTCQACKISTCQVCLESPFHYDHDCPQPQPEKPEYQKLPLIDYKGAILFGGKHY